MTVGPLDSRFPYMETARTKLLFTSGISIQLFWPSTRGRQTLVRLINVSNQQIRSITIYFPRSVIFHATSFSFSLHRTVSMDQLEPDNQVVAVLPVEPSLEQGLTADGKRQLHLFSCWFQVASADHEYSRGNGSP